MQMARIRIRPGTEPERPECVKAPVRVAKLNASLVHKLPVAGIEADGCDRGYGEVAEGRHRRSPSDYARALESGTIHSVEQCRECEMHYVSRHEAAEIVARILANAIESPLDIGVINRKCHFLSDFRKGAFITPPSVTESLQ